MEIAGSVKLYLERNRCFYQVVEQDSVPLDQCVQAHLFSQRGETLMAITRAGQVVSSATIGTYLQYQVSPMSGDAIGEFYGDCDSDSIPALPLYGDPVFIVDSNLFELEMIYFHGGRRGALVRMVAADFMRLHENAIYGFGCVSGTEYGGVAPPRMLIRKRATSLDQFPTVSSVAQRILELQGEPNALPRDLAEIICTEPGLAAQILRQANSAFFGNREPVVSVEKAILNTLGFDFTMSVALGIAMLDTLSIPQDGPLGKSSFFANAICCADICQQLALQAGNKELVDPNVAYLAGLLHDMGYLVLGHLFPQEFDRLNQVIQTDTDLSHLEIEHRLLDVTHAEIGGWLVQSWGIPHPIAVAVREHHNPNYDGADAAYPRLIRIATDGRGEYGTSSFSAAGSASRFFESVNLDYAKGALAWKSHLRRIDDLISLGHQLSQ